MLKYNFVRKKRKKNLYILKYIFCYIICIFFLSIATCNENELNNFGKEGYCNNDFNKSSDVIFNNGNLECCVRNHLNQYQKSGICQKI